MGHHGPAFKGASTPSVGVNTEAGFEHQRVDNPSREDDCCDNCPLKDGV